MQERALDGNAAVKDERSMKADSFPVREGILQQCDSFRKHPARLQLGIFEKARSSLSLGEVFRFFPLPVLVLVLCSRDVAFTWAFTHHGAAPTIMPATLYRTRFPFGADGFYFLS